MTEKAIQSPRGQSAGGESAGRESLEDAAVASENAEVVRTDVAIVGGGLVGATLALALSQAPVNVLVLEGQSLAGNAPAGPAHDVNDVEPRVSAITEASRRLLTELGVWDHLPANRTEAYRQMVVWDGEGNGEIVFHADDLQVPQLGHIIENRVLQQALVAAMRDHSRIRLMDQVEVTAWQQLGQKQGSLIRLADGRQVQAQLVVGADGANSRIRQWAGLPIREWDYEQQAIVCTIRTETGHRHTAWQRFSLSGPLAFLPVAAADGDDHLTSIVWSQDTAEARRLMALDDAAFRRALEAASESRLGRVVAVSRRYALPLKQRHAKAYTGNGVALVGDAAHTIHPLAGQGVNLGFADAAVLADEVRRGLVRNLSVFEPNVLERYERRRQGDNLAVMAGMEGFKRLFGRDELPLRWLRNSGMRWVNRQAPLKRWLAAEAMGLHKGLPRFSRPVR